VTLKRLATTVLALIILGAGCSDDPLIPHRTNTPDPLDQTPRPDYEAEVVALALSGELVAPQALYEEVRDGLERLRSLYFDQIPELQVIPFRHCWMPGEVSGMLTEAATAEIRAGIYTEMDSLNAALRLASIDTTSFSFRPNQLYFQLFFEGRLHPQRLSEMYGALPSVEYASPGYVCFDRSGFYAHFLDGAIAYLFRRGWGDCPAGCIFSEFWYFRIRGGSDVEYVGYWDPQSDPPPEWWPEARVSWCVERSGFGWCSD
jgi:hypothetical protein